MKWVLEQMGSHLLKVIKLGWVMMKEDKMKTHLLNLESNRVTFIIRQLKKDHLSEKK